MRVVGRDYIFKLSNQSFFKSVFEVRKKYFIKGQPQELAKNSTIFFALKDAESRQYLVVGTGKPILVRPVNASDRDEDGYSEEHRWPLVIELTELAKFDKQISATEIFSEEVLKKAKSRRPFGIELSPAESRTAKERIAELSSKELQ